MIPGPERQRQLQAEIISELEGRLAAGRKTYGDQSLLRNTDDLIGEVEEELLDVAGWAFVAWVRVRMLRGRSE